jgi:hypothetical protein
MLGCAWKPSSRDRCWACEVELELLDGDESVLWLFSDARQIRNLKGAVGNGLATPMPGKSLTCRRKSLPHKMFSLEAGLRLISKPQNQIKGENHETKFIFRIFRCSYRHRFVG